jgi:hypothetical protein
LLKVSVWREEKNGDETSRVSIRMREREGEFKRVQEREFKRVQESSREFKRVQEREREFKRERVPTHT